MEYSGMYVTDFDKPPFVTSEDRIILKNTSINDGLKTQLIFN